VVSEHQASRVADERGLEPEVVENHVILLGHDGWEVEWGLGEDQMALLGFDLQHLLEDVVPDVLLQIPVDDVPAVNGAAQVEAGDVLDAVDLVAHIGALVTLRLGHAVGNHAAQGCGLLRSEFSGDKNGHRKRALSPPLASG